MKLSFSLRPRRIAAACAPLLMLAAMQHAMAAHPLVTDDTGTQGTGNSQLELNADRANARDGSSGTAGSTTYTFGLLDTLDTFVNQPFAVSAPRGIGDTQLGLKWRFFEDEGTSIAFKPWISFGNANEDKGFGAGTSNASATLIVSHEAGPWTFHYNIGLTTNRFYTDANRDANRHLLWATSAAAAYQLSEQFKLVGDLGISRNPDIATSQNPAFAIIGAVYSPTKSIDLDIGYKHGLNDAEIKDQFGAGLTLRF